MTERPLTLLTQERFAEILAKNHKTEDDLWNLCIDTRIRLRREFSGLDRLRIIPETINVVAEMAGISRDEAQLLHSYLYEKKLGS
jgi:hypothetical protein